MNLGRRRSAPIGFCRQESSLSSAGWPLFTLNSVIVVNLPTCNLTCHETPACFPLLVKLFFPCYSLLVYYRCIRKADIVSLSSFVVILWAENENKHGCRCWKNLGQTVCLLPRLHVCSHNVVFHCNEVKLSKHVNIWNEKLVAFFSSRCYRF